MESPFKTSLPAVFSPKQSSATFPLTHGSAAPGSQRTSSFPAATRDEPVAATSTGHQSRSNSDRKPFDAIHPNNLHHDSRSDPHVAVNAHRQKRQSRHLTIDTTSLERGKLKQHHHKHKHSKSRDGRLPRTMTQIASSAGARGLLPTWSGSKEKARDGDDGLLRPITRETTRSRWGSDSTGILDSESRRSSLLNGAGQDDRIGPVRRQEIRSTEDLEQVKNRRKQGEEYLRSALSSIGTLATDITRRLDYTYYNLLEKITALNSTISSFQELSDSTSALFGDFEREITGLDQEIRKQVGELRGFQPQIQKIETLEKRMRAGRAKADVLGNRLEAMRTEIDRWERREEEWQTRISRRLRIFWGMVVTAVMVLLIAVAIQNWPAIMSHPSHEVLSQVVASANQSSGPELVSGLHGQGGQYAWSQYQSSLPYRQASRISASSANTPTAPGQTEDASPTNPDPLRILDEL